MALPISCGALPSYRAPGYRGEAVRANLVAVPDSGLHDLPPRWDGTPVAWRGWESFEAFVCGPRRAACESCGSLEQPTLNMGLVGDDPTMTPEDVRRDDEAVKLAYSTGHRRERHSWIQLTAFRCAECGADSIVDDDGVVWTLDLSDYGDAGSEPPATEEARQ